MTASSARARGGRRVVLTSPARPAICYTACSGPVLCENSADVSLEVSALPVETGDSWTPPSPLAFLLLLSGWVNRQQQAVIDYLLEVNRILRAVPAGSGSLTTSGAAS